jgi:hypothetical protein
VSELDDEVQALRRRQAESERIEETDADRRRSEVASEAERIRPITSEFLTRMERKGNPGTQEIWVTYGNQGILRNKQKDRRRSAWLIRNVGFGNPRADQYWLVPDGTWVRSPHSETKRRTYWAIEDSAVDAPHADVRSVMAAILARYDA